MSPRSIPSKMPQLVRSFTSWVILCQEPWRVRTQARSVPWDQKGGRSSLRTAYCRHAHALRGAALPDPPPPQLVWLRHVPVSPPPPFRTNLFRLHPRLQTTGERSVWSRAVFPDSLAFVRFLVNQQIFTVPTACQALSLAPGIRSRAGQTWSQLPEAFCLLGKRKRNKSTSSPWLLWFSCLEHRSVN